MATKTAVIYLRVEPELYDEADDRALSLDRSLHDYVRHLIREDLRNSEKQEATS